MMEFIISAASVAVTALVGWLAYKVSDKRQSADAGSDLIEDALKIKEVYHAMYEEMEAKFDALSAEMDAVIRKGEMWRGVAVDAAKEHQRRFGTAPKWWPSDEPLPSEA